MKVPLLVVVASTIGVATRTARAFTASSSSSSRSAAARSSARGRPLRAEIRPPRTKNEILEYGWDGTTALGKAVVDSKPARLLDEIRASGEVQSEACRLFNANLGAYYYHHYKRRTLLSIFGGRGTELAYIYASFRLIIYIHSFRSRYAYI